MKSFFQFGIFQKLLLTMLFVALVPLSAIWYIDQQNARQQISSSVNQQLSDISDKLTDQVNGWVTMNLKALRQNAALADMRSMDAARQNPILRSVLDEYDWSYLVFTIAPNGMNVGRSDNKEPINYADRIYFKQAISGEPYGKQVIISRTTNRPALILSAPITDGTPDAAPGNIIGVIALGAHLTTLSELITGIRIGSTGYAFLLDDTGKVIAHQQQEYVEKMVDFTQHPAYAARPDSGKNRATFEENGKQIIAYVQTTEHGWTIVAQQDYDEAYRPIEEANRNALVLLGLTVVVVTLIAYFFSGRLTTPIRNLTRLADEMSRGRAVPRMREAERKDEIGSLARAIDRMGTSIRLAIERLTARKSA